MKNFLLKRGIWILILFSLLSRLPQLLSDNLLLDGDECIVGLMAKHLYEGKEVPFYFYGQTYGFAFIEVLSIVPFYFFFGINDISVKLAMLSLWTTGLIFFYKALKQINDPDSLTPLLISLVLVFIPAWAVWSMKARGGYITAFTLSNACIYLMLRLSLRLRLSDFSVYLIFVLLGFLSIVIYESQPLWLPGLFPLLVYAFYKNKKFKLVGFFCIGFLTGFIFFHFIEHSNVRFWTPHVIGLPENMLNVLTELPKRVFGNIQGSYDYRDVADLNIVTNLFAGLFTFFVFCGLMAGVYYLLKKSNAVFLYLFCLSVSFTFLYLFVLFEYYPRYLLPLTGFALLLFSEIVNKIRSSSHYAGIFIFFLSLGVVSIISFEDYRLEAQTKKELKNLSNYLVSKDVHYVFCRGGLLQWQLDFYSGEKVIARYSGTKDRYPEYIERVNEAFKKGKPIAMVDFSYYHPSFEKNEKVILFENTYLVHLNPDKDELVKYDFDMSDKTN